MRGRATACASARLSFFSVTIAAFIDAVIVMRRYRVVLTLLLSLLVVGMQQEALRHALSHVARATDQPQLVKPAPDVPCVECAWLAAGSAALTCDPPATPAAPDAFDAPAPTQVAPSPARPSFYRSRAPPSFA